MNKHFASLALFALTFAAFPAPSVHAATTLQAGDLIRGETFSAVYYYGEDGFRYVFPNDKTYFTWYSDFDDVKWITDEELGRIQIGGNVTYKPGVKMVKIQSDPKVFYVGQNGELFYVLSEADAAAAYGANWNTMIDDIPDAFFSNYTINLADAFYLNSEYRISTSITDDKGLTAYTVMTITDSSFMQEFAGGSEITIDAGETIMFVNNDDVRHTATADDNSWGTGTMNYLENFVIRFETPGTYTFHCSYHTGMTGTIIVE